VPLKRVTWANADSPEEFAGDITRLRKDVDVVIASLEDFEGKSWIVSDNMHAIDAGADVVFGHART
jgi:hypothetical protein